MVSANTAYVGTSPLAVNTCIHKEFGIALAPARLRGTLAPVAAERNGQAKAGKMVWWYAILWLAIAGPTLGPAFAQCAGHNLIDQLPADQRSVLDDLVSATRYHDGNLWHAEKPGSRIDLVGTLHLYDPRMVVMMNRIGPLVDQADLVLVEAGPQEMAALQMAATTDPKLLFRPDGPTLPEQLSKAEWKALSAELSARGVPPFLGSKFQPWYVAMLLGLPACAATQLAGGPKGLDDLVMQRAKAAGVPVKALEPYDTVFRLFAGMDGAEQIDMIRTALAMAQGADDAFATMIDSYFAGQHRLIWEFTRMQANAAPGLAPGRAAAEFAVMEQALLIGRTVPWMDVLLPAAQGKHVLVAVGAAHLSGEQGLLSLLAKQGYTLTKGDL